MKLHIKAAGDRAFSVDVEPDTTIEALGQKLSTEHNLPSDVSRLVFRGRILKGPATQTLSSHGITEGSTIYMLKKAAAATTGGASSGETSAAPAATQPTPQQNVGPQTVTGGGASAAASPPNPFAAFGGGNPFANFGGGGAGAGANPFAAMGGLDPGMLSSMMQNPMMQQMMNDMMSNPEVMRSVIQSNPMLQSMAANNPLLSQALSDPALLQQMMNPSVLQATQQMFGGARTAPGVAQPGPTPNPAPAAQSPPDLSALLGGLGGMSSPGATAGSSGGNDFMASMSRMMQDPAIQQQMNSLMANMGAGGSMGGLEGLLAGLGGGAPPSAGGAPAGGAPVDRAAQAERYKEQLKTLEDMGFLDRDANLQALINSAGDVNRAISILLEQGFGN